jgi:hypothetical protein
MNPRPRRESCGVLVGVADVVAMRQKDSGDSSMLLEKILETSDVARRIDEQIALAALDEVRMRSVRGARIEPASENAVRDFLRKVGLWRTSSAIALY